MGWWFNCAKHCVGENHDEREEQDDHQRATACLVVAMLEPGYRPFCGLESGQSVGSNVRRPRSRKKFGTDRQERL